MVSGRKVKFGPRHRAADFICEVEAQCLRWVKTRLLALPNMLSAVGGGASIGWPTLSRHYHLTAEKIPVVSDGNSVGAGASPRGVGELSPLAI